MKKYKVTFHSRGDRFNKVTRIVLRNSRKELVDELKSNAYIIDRIELRSR